MKILLLPNNIASEMNETIPYLIERGHEAKGVIFNKKSVITSNENIEVLPIANGSDISLTTLLLTPFSILKTLYLIYKSDIVHWIFGYKAQRYKLFFAWIKLLKKPAVIGFCGTDIRYYTPSENIEEALQIYTKNKEQSLTSQKIFAHHGFIPMVYGYELEDYIEKSYFKKLHKNERIVNTDKLKPILEQNNEKIKIIHAPSKKDIKGTKYVLEAIQELKEENNQSFDFELIENLNHDELIQRIQQADIVIDQLLIGDHGTLSLEAMALEKPVLCYLTKKIEKRMPDDCPIINTNKDTLSRDIKKLIEDKNKREELGKAGRKYVEKIHAPDVVIDNLLKIYNDVYQG